MVTRMNRIVTLSSDVLYQEVAGEGVLLDLKSERYFGLDEVGARIWELLQQGGTSEQVFDVLLAEYEVDPQRLAGDLDDLLEKLAAAGLIEIRSADGDVGAAG